MLQHVNTVLIAKTAPTSFSTADVLADGAIALFDENKKILTSTVLAAAAKSIYVGVCEGKEDVYDQKGAKSTKSVIRFSMPIQKGSNPTLVVTPFVAKTEDKIVITATNVTPEVGHRYVLRLVYNDIYEAPGQFTHTYEVIAKTTTPKDLVDAFVKKINKHKEARVTASASAAVLTLTAKEIPYNEGITLDHGYTQVSVEAFMWTTIPSGLLSNVMYPISNLTIAKTQGTPGKGNAYIVRDREDAAMGYRGITHRANGIYPYIAPEFRSDLSAEYDTITMEWDNKYLSDDNQYIKTTPLAVEMYIVKDQIKTNKLFVNMIKSFISGAEVSE
ncbi:hypothetical protein KNV27_gp003 [uncultured phage cr55_1]|uniref:Uncharacterized protein n=1 Tax=uncultured phage cr55_1 TaxID=2772060 RepID=A0A7M1RUQ9_9CAUD|nr:hypothetical protein KNV27_gp003 [uncultured phage cr55_1]QOR58078.1 hypothetical protein [uncultured phage cr55_1]